MPGLEYSGWKSRSHPSADFIYRRAHELFRAGNWSELVRFLDSPEASKYENMPELKLLLADAALRLGNPHEALALANEIVADSALPLEMQTKARLVRASACRLRGFTDAALEDAGAASALLQNASAPLELRIECHRQLGAALLTKGELDEAVQQLEQGLMLCGRSSDLGLFAATEDNLAVALAQMGEPTKALVHFNRVKAAYQKLNNKSALAGVLNNIGRLYYDLGQNDVSLTVLQEALEAAQQSKYRRLEATALISIGDTLQQMGRYEEALKYYGDALKPTDEVLEPRLSCYANIGLGTAFCSLGHLQKARLMLEQAQYEADKQRLKLEHSVARLNLGILDLKNGDYKKALEQMVKAISQLEKVGARRELLKGYLHLAFVCLRVRRWARLRKCLELTAFLVGELNLREQLVLEAKAVPEVIEYAASKRICGSLFLEIKTQMQRLHPITETSFPIGTITSTHDTTAPYIHIYSLGKSLILIEGRRISDTEWRSQKAKELFLYLLCHRREFTREELLEVLWPDLSASLSRNALYNNVYRVRKALYERCLIQTDGRYQLNPASSFCFDLEEFQQLICQAAQLPRGSEERSAFLLKAIQLYRGSFLEDFYAEWSDTIRLQVEAQYLQSLASLAGFYAGQGEYSIATQYLEKLLSVDDINEEAHEGIIANLLKQGDVRVAYQRYRHYQALLKEQLNAEPSKSFKQLCVEAGLAS